MMPHQEQRSIPEIKSSELNQTYLDSELRRLRLLLQRRVLWLRKEWKSDPLQNYQAMVISDAKADELLDGERLEKEAQFYHEEPEAVHLSGLLAEIETEIEAQRMAAAEAGSMLPVDVLAGLFNLNPFERNVLLLCLAPELDPAFERIYAYVQDDVSKKYVTSHLALALLGGSGHDLVEARKSLMSGGTLRRSKLLIMEPAPWPSALRGIWPLRLDESITCYLTGNETLDERISHLLTPVSPVHLASQHDEQVKLLGRWILSEIQSNRGRRLSLNLYGPNGVGKREVACALCRRLGLQLFSLDWKQLPSVGHDRYEVYQLLERDMLLFQGALYIDASIDQPGGEGSSLVEETLERLGAFLFLGSRSRLHTDVEMLSVEVPKSDAAARHALWEHAFSGSDLPKLDLDAVVQQFEFGPHEIARAAQRAWDMARMRGSDDVDKQDLWQACRELAGHEMGELAQRIVPMATWDDIVLPDDALKQLHEIAAQVALRQKVYGEWGFGKKLSRGKGISALFSGPSGTGKTMAAEILANHLDLDLYRIDLAGVVSKYIGETEKNLRKVFDAAEESGAILFFDEADALFGKRSEVKDSHDRYANIEVNYLLQRMEDYRGLAILATNRRSALDQAFLRRLRFLVDLPFPDSRNRRLIWQKIFPKEASLDGLDYDFLARMEVSGGNIRNIALNAAFLAADEDKPIGMGHIMQAARREYLKISKMITEQEFGRYYGMVRQ